MKSVALASVVTALVSVALSGAVSTAGPRFYRDDPLPREPESQDAQKAARSDIGDLYEMTYNLFVNPATSHPDARQEPEYDRRGFRLELVYEPDWRAHRDDR